MDIEAFLKDCDRYCKATSLSEARLSTILFGSGVTIGRLRGGGGVTVRVLSRAVSRLAARQAADRKTTTGETQAIVA